MMETSILDWWSEKASLKEVTSKERLHLSKESSCLMEEYSRLKD